MIKWISGFSYFLAGLPFVMAGFLYSFVTGWFVAGMEMENDVTRTLGD